MATAPESGIGTVVSITAGVPATEDQSGYEAQSFDEIGKVVAPLAELSESAEEGTQTLLKTGVTQSFNGAKRAEPFDISYVYDATDPGQVIVRANKNTNNEVTLEVAYPSSTKTMYVQAVLANLRTSEAGTNTNQGETINVRPISLWTTV